MTMRRAADARVKINGNLYAVQRWRITSRSQGINVSNTEGVTGSGAASVLGYTSKIPDLHDAQIELTNASFDDAANPFAGPVSLDDGSFYTILLYPAGINGPKWTFPYALCTQVSHEGSIPGAQPVSATFEGDGSYSVASS